MAALKVSAGIGGRGPALEDAVVMRPPEKKAA
jgi:hypothetical protein